MIRHCWLEEMGRVASICVCQEVIDRVYTLLRGGSCRIVIYHQLLVVPGMQLPYCTQGASDLENGLKNDFCKNYIKLKINKMDQKVG